MSLVLQPGIGDGLIHGDMVPGGAVGMEAHGAAIDQGFRIERRRAMHLTTKTKLGVFIGPDDAGARRAQRGENLVGVIADRGNNANAGDDDAPHDFNSCWRGAFLAALCTA